MGDHGSYIHAYIHTYIHRNILFALAKYVYRKMFGTPWVDEHDDSDMDESDDLQSPPPAPSR